MILPRCRGRPSSNATRQSSRNPKYLLQLLIIFTITSSTSGYVSISNPFLRSHGIASHLRNLQEFQFHRTYKKTDDRSNSVYNYHKHNFRSITRRVFVATAPLGGRIGDIEVLWRLLTATFAGTMIGFERRYSERPAGIRTMALVSLGACVFTLASILGFGDDSARIAANVASGVGFIGAGVISKTGIPGGKASRDEVKGLTTAATIWLSAGLGVASGAGLTTLTLLSATITITVLRVGRFRRQISKKLREYALNIETKNVPNKGPNPSLSPKSKEEKQDSKGAQASASSGVKDKEEQLKNRSLPSTPQVILQDLPTIPKSGSVPAAAPISATISSTNILSDNSLLANKVMGLGSSSSNSNTLLDVYNSNSSSTIPDP